MSDNIENSNEWVNWIEEAISKKHIKYYEYQHFSDMQEIGCGNFGKVYRADWKNSRYLALKSIFNLSHITIKEIVNEVITNKVYILRLYKVYNFYLKNFSLNFNVKLIFMK